MASPFAKYQSEQVQQIAPGFVEAFGRAGASIGQGIQNAASGIAQGIEEREKIKKEEAKQQAFLGSYLKRDPRVQSVKSMIAGGLMKLDDKGDVFIPEEHRDKFDPTKASDAISFYNQIGGDGSKLSGDALTKFVTQFEADKKFEADEAAKVAAALERRKVEAEINKMNADAAEKYARVGINSVIGGFASGQDMSTFQPTTAAMPSFTAPSAPSATPSAPSSLLAAPVPSVASGINTTLGTSDAPAGFTPERYQAGVPLATTLKTAAPSPVASTTPGAKTVAPAPAAVTKPMGTATTPADTSKAYLVEIPKLQSARAALDADFQKDMAKFSANHQIGMARLTQMGATGEDIKAYEASAKTQYDLKVQRYNANVASLESRLGAFQKAADEARAAEKAAQGGKAETRAAAGEKREQVKFDVEYGTAGTPAAAKKYTTFTEKIQDKIQSAGIIPGRTGGTKSAELQRAAQEYHAKIMRDYPTWYAVGLTTAGGNEYQFKMLDTPTSAPINQAKAASIQEVVDGYAEGRVFLSTLLEAVNASDPERVKNYLDRFLVTTSKDDLFAEAEALGQFGVAAFRRAIVSGGNFSDADREYVQKLITQINTPNPFANKDFLLAQTKKLASFIDAKFRSTLAANGVRLDLDTSEKFLKREGEAENADALDNLRKAREYYKAYNIPVDKVVKATRGNESIDPAELRQQIKTAEDSGNMQLKKVLEKILQENIESKEKARKKAAEEAARARGA